MSELLDIISAKFDKHLRKCFVLAIILGFAVHGYVISNLMVNHDSIVFLIDSKPDIRSGRWARVFWGGILSGNYQSPWIIGITTIIVLAVSITIVLAFFGNRKAWQDYLIVAIFVSFPVIACNFSYMFMSNEYAMALLFAVIGAVTAGRKEIYCKIIAVFSYIMCCAIYQSYIHVAIVLIAFKFICALFDEEDIKKSIKTVLINMVVMLVSMVVYYGITALVLKISGMEINRDAGLSLNLFTLKMIYVYFRDYIFRDKAVGGGRLHGILLALTYMAIALKGSYVLYKRKKEGILRMVLFLLTFCIMPLCFNALCLAVGYQTHQLMEFSFVFLYIFPIAFYERIFDEKECRIADYYLAFMMLVVTSQNIKFCNTCYYSLGLAYESSYSLANRIATHIEETEGWKKDTPVLFVGKLGWSETIYGETKPLLKEELKNVTGYNAGDYVYERGYLLRYFMNDYLGVKLPEPTEEMQEEILQSGIIDKMQSFPEKGSMEWYKGTLVIKLSDERVDSSLHKAYKELYVH
ncbi:MAG: glucosyltransferase domain-containing protein [Lachnospiraceae bacterium]|nr:glucosyltransferase domain-containing protein [Lachnospiraceae bacterium]